MHCGVRLLHVLTADQILPAEIVSNPSQVKEVL